MNALVKAPSCGLLPGTALFWNRPIPVTAPLMLYLPSGPASMLIGSASCSGPVVEGVGNGVGAAGAASAPAQRGQPVGSLPAVSRLASKLTRPARNSRRPVPRNIAAVANCLAKLKLHGLCRLRRNLIQEPNSGSAVSNCHLPLKSGSKRRASLTAAARPREETHRAHPFNRMAALSSSNYDPTEHGSESPTHSSVQANRNFCDSSYL